MAMLSSIPPWEMTEIAGKSQIAGNSRARRKFVRWLDRALSSLTLPRRHLVSYALRSSSWMTLGVSTQTHFLCQNVVQIVSSDTSFSTDGITVALRKSHTNRKKDLYTYRYTCINCHTIKCACTSPQSHIFPPCLSATHTLFPTLLCKACMIFLVHKMPFVKSTSTLFTGVFIVKLAYHP